MSNTSLLGSYGGIDGSALMFRNRIINGNFDIWQRGTTNAQVDSYNLLADRWMGTANISTRNYSRQSFSVGQTDVPGNPTYFARMVATTASNLGSFVYFSQNIEGVDTFAGQIVTASFYAKADSNKNIAVEFIQDFGTGGSSAVLGLGVTTISLTSSWRKYTVTTTLPSISGKTLGTGHKVGFQFWLEAGSNFNARTNSLGNQSGTFDFSQVQVEAGAVATPFEQRPLQVEDYLCKRYYERALWGSKPVMYCHAGGASVPVSCIPKRATPRGISVSAYPAIMTYSGAVIGSLTGVGYYAPLSDLQNILFNFTGTLTPAAYQYTESAGAYYVIDSEL